MLEPNRDQIEIFVDALFRYAAPRGYVSLRAFFEGGNKSFRISPTSLTGGLKFLVDAAEDDARRAANDPKSVVFCPPIAVFANKDHAGEKDLAEGLALSVECDQQPSDARDTLERLIGPATLVVRSGGLWTDPATGEIHDKLHLHWRLAKPAQGEDLTRLKSLRSVTARIVGGDPSNDPVCHPIRWPGSWHRKDEPRLCEIVAMDIDRELDLTTALEILTILTRNMDGSQAAKNDGQGKNGEGGADWASLLNGILAGKDLHHSLASLAAKLVVSGMADGAAVNLLRACMSASTAPHDQRWQERCNDIPRAVSTARDKYGQAQNETSAAEDQTPLFDPWAQYIVPAFPLDVLPEVVRTFVLQQSVVVGCDVSALAMAALTVFSSAIDHRFKIKMMRHGQWWERPRLWTLLVGDPSRKKTPIINVMTRPLEQHQNELREGYETVLQAYESATADGDKTGRKPPLPPRFIMWDTTTEKLAEILSRTERGVLVKRDEFAGWISGMEKYNGNSRGAGSDRAFWLQSFDGGPYSVDRISRGESYIKNLSVSLIGGIQPSRLAELHGLTSDGLLQRFIPVMMGPSTFAQDRPSNDDTYTLLVRELICAQPRRLALSDAAVQVMTDLRRHLHELEQEVSGLAVGFQGFLGKLPGLAGSLALILHVAADPHTTALVELATAENVRRLVIDFILPHAYEFYRTAESISNGDRLRKLASWVLTSGKPRIVASDLARNVADFRGQTLTEVNDRLSPLVAAAWLQPEERGPSNRAWQVNPVVFQQFADRARAEDQGKARVAELMGAQRKRGGNATHAGG